MGPLILFATLLAISTAKPVTDKHIVQVTQDTSGFYKYFYDIGDISKVEEATKEGQVLGRFSYVDGDGITQRMVYLAGENGFQVLSATNLPKKPQETPEVLKAREEHKAAYEKALRSVPITKEFGEVPKKFESPLSGLVWKKLDQDFKYIIYPYWVPDYAYAEIAALEAKGYLV